MAMRTVTLLVVGFVLTTPLEAQQRVRVVATLPTYASIAREVAGDRADVSSIARGDEDPHFVTPRPSFAAQIQRADLFIVTGLDLEIWVPALLDRANNRKVLEGQPGYVAAYRGITLLDIPATVSRTEGDVHVYGNPHIHTDPINAIVIARNIAAGLERIDPRHQATYRQNVADFERRILERLFGEKLVQMLGVETLFGLAASQQFWSFATEEQYAGQPLTAYLGGWMAAAQPFRDLDIVCYHKNWAYFSARFRVRCAEYVEPKPGIPPTPGHVGRVIEFIRAGKITVLFAANYYAQGQIERIAARAGVRAVVVPEHVEGERGIDDYFTLVDAWIDRLARGVTSERR